MPLFKSREEKERIEQLILRCKKYPKKGSNEWIVSGDSIEFRVIEKEKKNQTFLLSNIAKAKLNTKSSSLELRIEVDGRFVTLPLIFFNAEDVGIL